MAHYAVVKEGYYFGAWRPEGTVFDGQTDPLTARQAAEGKLILLDGFESRYVTLDVLQTVTAGATDFAAFKTAVAALGE